MNGEESLGFLVNKASPKTDPRLAEFGAAELRKVSLSGGASLQLFCPQESEDYSDVPRLLPIR
jgi:hypothetical protein